MKTLKVLILSLSVFSIQAGPKRVRALVIAPVADACGSELASKKAAAYYKAFPCAPDTGPTSCMRIHQLRYNDLVTITQELPSGEVAVRVSGLFYLDGLHRKQSSFWMLKKNLAPLNKLPKGATKHIPPPIDYKKSPSEYTKNVLTLSVPWFDKKTNKLYSAGTRFRRCPENDTDTAYGISYIHPLLKTVVYTRVPQSKGLVTYYSTFERARRVFMSILRGWAHRPVGLIPYIYGGFSFTVPCIDKGFKKIRGTQCGKKATYWKRPGFTVVPKSGFDCSNMILSAAQMAGLPYYFKNTLALMKYLRPLKSGEKLEEGDLIWYSGHVLVISDVKKNLVIESVGYDSGFGRLHELSLNKVFKGIKTFMQLRRVHFRKHFIWRLNSKGRPWRSVYQLRIFKLRSIQDLSY